MRQALFFSALRARLAGPGIWLLLLLPILSFGSVRLMPAEEVSAPVQVGVVLPETGGGAFWRRLEARGGLAVTFLPAGLERAAGQVAAGRWDCALVLPEDFQDRLDRLELDGLFTLLIAPGSAAYPLVRETAAACVMECVSPAVAEQYLLGRGLAEDTQDLRSRLDAVLPERVLVTLETLDGQALSPLELADRGTDQVLAGLIAVLLAVWTLCAAMDLGRWLDSPFAQRLIPLRGRLPLLLPRLAAALLPALGFGSLALLALDRPAVLTLVPWLLLWGAAALALALRPALWQALPVLIPFLPVLALVLTLAAVPWAPTFLYLQIRAGSWRAALALTAEAAAWLGAALLLEKRT